ASPPGLSENFLFPRLCRPLEANRRAQSWHAPHARMKGFSPGVRGSAFHHPQAAVNGTLGSFYAKPFLLSQIVGSTPQHSSRSPLPAPRDSMNLPHTRLLVRQLLHWNKTNRNRRH